ncbi:MAG: hypothetical protein P8L77_01555 [Gammaproteobacteria bacterium]|nr:hypothetical protein [Gammaproteobacteria bacterium]
MKKNEKDTLDLCHAIEHANLPAVQNHLKETKLKTIQVLYEIRIKENTGMYSPSKHRTIDLRGRSFFHLVAFTSNLEMLYTIHSALFIPIIPVNVATLHLNNPFQYLWEHGKEDMLAYCMSMSEILGFDNVLAQLNIDSSKKFGHLLKDKQENTIDKSTYECQLTWLENKEWQHICDAILSNQWIVSMAHLETHESSGLMAHIDDSGSETLKTKYQTLKTHALHEKKNHQMIKSTMKKPKAIAKQSNWPSARQIGFGVLTTVSLFFVARNLFSGNQDGAGIRNNSE